MSAMITIIAVASLVPSVYAAFGYREGLLAADRAEIGIPHGTIVARLGFWIGSRPGLISSTREVARANAPVPSGAIGLAKP